MPTTDRTGRTDHGAPPGARGKTAEPSPRAAVPPAPLDGVPDAPEERSVPSMKALLASCAAARAVSTPPPAPRHGEQGEHRRVPTVRRRPAT